LIAPLTNLTKKGVFNWLGEAQEIFERLKKVMSSCLVLALPNFTQSDVLECDASEEGIGAFICYSLGLYNSACRKIISDTDNRFTGAFWKELFKMVGIALSPSTSYHP
jgi:hypothetical protein